MIHVCLLTCDRFEYTMQTARSFLGRNPNGFELWHADDCSAPGLRASVQDCGFRPLVYTDARVGVTEMVRRIAQKLQSMGAEWMLLLENDWETVRPFPWDIFRAVESEAWALRLYGRFKGRNGKRPVKNYHQGRGKADPGWKAFNGYELGHIHWGNPPSVARVDRVAWIHEGAQTERQAIERSGLILDPVARVTENVVYHIGDSRTPGFVP